MGESSQVEGISNIQSDEQASHNIVIHVHPTTGGQFEIEISPDETADELRRRISRRLQTPKERLKVLYKEQVLEAKPLKEYNIMDGSNVTLLPAVESGFSSTVQGTQQSIIQAIESLSDPQIDDFLSGRLPLTLALRVGDHMMFVQLQLEQSQLNHQPSTPSRSRNSHSSTPFTPSHPLISTAPGVSPRVFPDMHKISIPPALAATAVLPKSASDNSNDSTKTSLSRTTTSNADCNTVGPAPKVPKLSLKEGSGEPTSGIYSGNEKAASHKTEHYRSSSSSSSELPHAIFDPRFESLQRLTNHYNQIANHVNHQHRHHHHSQGSASHLQRLASACSSLGPVVALPPSGGAPLKVPSALPEHSVKSSRKRPSTLMASNYTGPPSPSAQSSSAFLDTGTSPALQTPAAIIQNALLRQHQLGVFPPVNAASLLPSAYAQYQASRLRQNSSRNSPAGDITPTSPPTELRLKHPITSTMLQATGNRQPGSTSLSSSGSKSERSHHHGHRRSSSTSGKITSSSMSSHHPSGMSGARVARQMQRLRRLCGSHQQCVAYSNRELATEISSIVHMAKHSHHQHNSRSDGSSHRKSHKSCRECHGRDRNSGSSSSRATPSSASAMGQTTGACIDSFTTHGPGIFSGTFSGSLHPSIQDMDGKPRRDPKTILQILTDLLNATQHYQGQLGNVGLLPQLFKDHFKAGEGSTRVPETGKDIPKPEVALAKAQNSRSSEDKEQKLPSKVSTQQKYSVERPSPSKQLQQKSQPGAVYPYVLPPNAFRPMVVSSTKDIPSPTSYLSSISTIPIGTIPVGYSHRSSRSRKSSPSSGQEVSKHHNHHHHHGRCHHYKHHHSNGTVDKSCCSLTSRRPGKSQILSTAYVKRLKQIQHENANTRTKVKELKQMFEMQRLRRQCRRHASKLCNRTRNIGTTVGGAATSATMSSTGNLVQSDESNNTSTQSALNGGKMEVQFDEIKEFEIKEVAHEPPETVTV